MLAGITGMQRCLSKWDRVTVALRERCPHPNLLFRLTNSSFNRTSSPALGIQGLSPCAALPSHSLSMVRSLSGQRSSLQSSCELGTSWSSSQAVRLPWHSPARATQPQGGDTQPQKGSCSPRQSPKVSPEGRSVPRDTLELG